MLVLSRRPGDGVQIGSDVLVTVLEVRGSNVRLGFEAPDGTPILRTELLARLNSSKVRNPHLRALRAKEQEEPKQGRPPGVVPFLRVKRAG